MQTDKDFLQIWAEEFKKNTKKNRLLLDKFITAQILQAQNQLKKLPIEKLIKIFGIKNEELIQTLKNSKLG